MKYRPDFPERFGSTEHGRSFCGDFLPWYNTEHHHVGLGLFTPHNVHHALAAEKPEQRALVFADAFARHPERFPNGQPKPKAVPTAVWINPPVKPTGRSEVEAARDRDRRSSGIYGGLFRAAWTQALFGGCLSMKRYRGKSILGPLLTLATMLVLDGTMALGSGPASSDRHSLTRSERLSDRLMSYFERASRVWDPDPTGIGA
jgi:hypothetical protein